MNNLNGHYINYSHYRFSKAWSFWLPQARGHLKVTLFIFDNKLISVNRFGIK